MKHKVQGENKRRQITYTPRADSMKIVSPAVLKQLLRERGLYPHRSRGQHFLVDENILEKILRAAALSNEDLVFDIGAGPGVLALAMAQRVKGVIAIEQDRGLAAFLREQVILKCLENVSIIEGDVRGMDLESLCRLHTAGIGHGQDGEKRGKVKVVANLPYYLTTPLLFQLLQGRCRPALLVLMVQLEVARRILADPGSKEYGTLSVLCRYYCGSSLLFKVSRNVFYPQPAVDSAVILLESLPRPSVTVSDEKLFWRIVRASFQQRRKTLLNALEGLEDLGREVWEQALARAEIDPKRRGETLSPGEFAKLSELLYN